MQNLSVGCLLLLFFSTLSCSNRDTPQKRSGKETREMLTVDGQVVALQSKDLSYSYTGSLVANEAIDIQPEISAKVTKIFFKEGAIVNKGELLVKMFDADLQAGLKKNQLLIELKQKEVDRKKELYLSKGISKEELDISENGLNTLMADRDLLKAQLSKTELIAPFNGIIGLRKVSEGAFVNSNIVIASLQQVDPIKLEFSIPEKYKTLIVDNMDLFFTVEGSDQRYSAKVYALESTIDASTRTIKIRALAKNSDRTLFPGSFVSIKLNFFPDKEAIFIPSRAVVPTIDGEQVFICKNGRVKSVKIVSGISTPSQVEVLSGLQVGDTLIESGLLQIKEGIPVRVKGVK